MENLIKYLTEFIEYQLENDVYDNKLETNAYNDALNDIKLIIDKYGMVGKYGFFWDDENNPVYYDKLISINIDDEFGDSISYSCNGMLPFSFFSLNPPKHLK